MRRASLAATAVAASILGATLGCAKASDGHDVIRDSCRFRDCGPTFGNAGDYFPDEDVGDDLGDDAFVAPTDDAADAPPLDDAAPPASEAAIDGSVDTPLDAPTDASSCTVPAGATCGLSPQCGCAAGEACDLVSASGGTRCAAAGSLQLGAACSTVGSCAAGLTCFGGLCQRLCGSTADCVGIAAASCSEIAPGASVCLSQCDPRAPSTVCGAQNCTVVDAVSGITSCIAAGGSYNGCTANRYACAPRYACVPDASGTGDTCLRWCRVGIDADCPSGKVCYAFSDHPTIGGVEYGVCDY